MSTTNREHQYTITTMSDYLDVTHGLRLAVCVCGPAGRLLGEAQQALWMQARRLTGSGSEELACEKIIINH